MAQTELSAITDEGINISGKFQSYKQPPVLAGKSGRLITYKNDSGTRLTY